MNKTQILSALNTTYPKAIAIPGGNPELIETVGDVKKYLFHRLETGLDQDGSPVAHKAFTVFYVWKEGDGAEEAFYEDIAAVNTVDKSLLGGKLQTIAALFASTLLRSRVRGALVKSSFQIAEEVGTTPNHAARIKWAFNAMKDVETFLSVVMCSLCSKSSIKDGTATDNDIQGYVNACIDTWSVLV